MRAVVLILAGLAGLKVWTHDHIYRSATEDALVHAYRDSAIDACQKGRRKDTDGKLSVNWNNTSSIHLVIGKRDVDVAIWDVDNPLWPVRYKYPLLVLKGGDYTCEFDMTLGTASVSRPSG